MLLKLFKNNHPFVLFLIPVLGILLWIPSLFDIPLNFPEILPHENTPLFDGITKPLSGYPKLATIIALVFLILQSFLIIRLNFKHIFIETRTYLPSVLFVIFGSLLYQYQQLHPALVVNFFLLWALDKALVIDKESNLIQRNFESGFILGLGLLFCSSMYVFIPVFWLALIILRNSRWREWTANLIGFVLPGTLYLTIAFLLDKHQQLIEQMQQNITAPAMEISLHPYAFIAIGLLAMLVLISILSVLSYVGVKKINTRKYFTFFFWFLILLVALYFFYDQAGHDLIFALAIPLSVIMSLFFIESRSKWVTEIFFILTLLSAFALIWMH